MPMAPKAPTENDIESKPQKRGAISAKRRSKGRMSAIEMDYLVQLPTTLVGTSHLPLGAAQVLYTPKIVQCKNN